MGVDISLLKKMAAKRALSRMIEDFAPTPAGKRLEITFVEIDTDACTFEGKWEYANEPSDEVEDES